MDWIRRNWPDLLIGMALVAVIAGIIATLLTGGSFFPLGASQASSNRPESSSTDFERSPVIGDRQEPAARPVVEQASTPAPTPAEAQSDEADEVQVSALPLPGSNEVARPPAGEDTDEPVTAVVTANNTSTAAASPVPNADEEGVYRISVGAFTAAENAERQAATFREAGYPVFVGTQGDLSIVLVGPYDELNEAERVAERIRAGGFRIEPVIYRFRADSESPAQSSTASVPAPQPQPSAAQATAGRYIQVGAYGNTASALPQRQRLEGLGFGVTERVEGNLVKLLVGPFAGEELSSAQSLLEEQGIDHFLR